MLILRLVNLKTSGEPVSETVCLLNVLVAEYYYSCFLQELSRLQVILGGV